jgi:hypothetical protein
VLTIGGEIGLDGRYFGSPSGGGIYRVDASMGIACSKASPAVREVCCTMGGVQDFAQGAEDMQRLTGLRISKERLRQITESEAAQIEARGANGTLCPSWSAQEETSAPNGPTRVYVGADGVMVRTVTQEEKDKRRRDHALRRRRRGRAHVGNTKPLWSPRPGSDERFKEMKIGLFYGQSKVCMHVFATRGNPEAFGVLLRMHAAAIQLEQARETLSLTDGGPWIRNQILQNLPHLDAMVLDFHHLSRHVWSTAHGGLGEGVADDFETMSRLSRRVAARYRPTVGPERRGTGNGDDPPGPYGAGDAETRLKGRTAGHSLTERLRHHRLSYRRGPAGSNPFARRSVPNFGVTVGKTIGSRPFKESKKGE